MQRYTPRTTWLVRAASLGAVGLIAAACRDEITQPLSPTAIGGPRLAVSDLTIDNRIPWVAPRDAQGNYLLPKACDVLIGEQSFAGPDPAPKKFGHQLFVVASVRPDGTYENIPAGSTVKLVRKSDYPDGTFPAYPDHPSTVTLDDPATVDVNEGGHPRADIFDDDLRAAPAELGTEKAGGVDAAAGVVFACDADDPTTAGGQPVVEPITDHAGKGDGPQINADGVTLDLNGFSIQAYNSATDLDPAYDNLGVVITGTGSSLVNSSAQTARVTRFGHNIEGEGESPGICGGSMVSTADGPRCEPRRGADGKVVYNIQAPGGVGVRLSSGTVNVGGVRTLDRSVEDGTTPVGVGFEIRRCARGSKSYIRDNHFVGNGEGVLIRECSGVWVENNYIGSPGGFGVATRAAVGQSGFPILIAGNTISTEDVSMTGVGPIGIAWQLSSDNLTITGNRITGFTRYVDDPTEPSANCGVSITSGTARPSKEALLAANTIDVDTEGPTIAEQVCGAPANRAPAASFTRQCDGLTCNFASTSTDPDADGAIRSYGWAFGNGQTSTAANPQGIQYAAAGSYTVTLTVTDNHGATNTKSEAIAVKAANVRPVASFRYTCTGTSCTFTNTSTDPDGDAIASSDWRLSNSTAWTTVSGAGNLTRTIAAGSNLSADLKVKDNGSPALESSVATQSGVRPMTLTVQKTSAGSAGNRAVLTWTGHRVAGGSVQIYRGGSTSPLLMTEDDGSWSDPTAYKGVTQRYQVCRSGDRTICTTVVSVGL